MGERAFQYEKQTWRRQGSSTNYSPRRSEHRQSSGSSAPSRLAESVVESFAMTDFVLIHGAWHGSWCWTRLRRLLAAEGHRVFTPTLTGLGERSHLLTRDVGLDTHIADVANLFIWEELRDIVLVGHSYGGVIVRHVADRMPSRIRSLVYLDAFVPENGKALFDYLPDKGKGDRNLAAAHGDGWRVPPRPASSFQVNAVDAAWADRQCTMHPLSTFEASARITGACDNIANIGYILARGFDGPFEQFDAIAERHGWWRQELECGHDVMLDAPNDLAALLQQRA
jgi:pimeloyl-ACP methyl ester carboxylesterase